MRLALSLLDDASRSHRSGPGKLPRSLIDHRSMSIMRPPIDREQKRKVYSRFITRNGKRIYHPKGGLFVFWVKV